MEPSSSTVRTQLIEWLKAIVFALVIVLIFRWFVFTPTIVSGVSMEPNFYHNERIIINKFIYYFKQPKHGEVIVFHADEEEDYIKRVIAVAGDTVKIIGDDVYVNDQLIHESYIAAQVEEAKRLGSTYNLSLNYKTVLGGVTAVEVPEGTVFVLGDNRSRSKDSRSDEVGFVPVKEIKGRVDVIFWPFNKFKLIKHPKDVFQS